jgi:hypothetical protein
MTAAAVLLGAATTRSDEIALQPKEPKKELPKKEPPVVPKKVEIREVKTAAVPVPNPWAGTIRVLYEGPIARAHGAWPGPVLPGMWGGIWGALWPNSWWMGGPYLYSTWDGPWGAGTSINKSGAHPWLLPPVFNHHMYPALSPYWMPRSAVYWFAPSAAPPAVFAGFKAFPVFFYPAPVPVVPPPPREMKLVPVPKKASAERLYIDAVVLYFEDNFESSRNHLAEAVKQSPRDARLWYYKALAERAMGDESAARNSAEKGAALEILGVSDKRSILTSLERIQGKDRMFLGDLVSGPKALSLQTASEIVANLKAGETTTVTSAK